MTGCFSRRFFHALSAAASLCLFAAPALAQQQPQQQQFLASRDPYCGPLRACAESMMPRVDDGTSPAAEIAARILPQCEPQAISCSDNLIAAAKQRMASEHLQNAQQAQAYMDNPEYRAKIENQAISTVLTIEVDIYRQHGEVPDDAAAPQQAGPMSRPTPSAASPYR